ncbi:hypothetical protein LPW11_01895 [Geomonas sp. RF6]|uniref:hypothetical protein n=1 Tax=Geomonas sp. RF6 TaxID=2897342 RepID=UPI001E37396D|nr:hypothetical protein [Geomonas sp. RF6]UFS70949.1 hypothetical protein LPW11_01895 [Geomonas sp. RF6]
MKKCIAIILLIVAMLAHTPFEAWARSAAPFSFDSLWFYRDGTRVVPEIGKRWVTVVFDSRYRSGAADFLTSGEEEGNVIQRRARGMVKSHKALSSYLYDPNLAEDACFFKLRDGVKLDQIGRLIGELKGERGVRYVHPTVIIDNKTFAFFDDLELEWKTGTPRAQRDSLLKAAHVAADDRDEKRKSYVVDLAAIPYFRAVNLLAEDVKVLKVAPRLVEIKPSISAKLSFLMGGANIGDSIPFTLTIAFSDRVSIDPSSIATLNLKPPELQKELFDCTFDPYDYAKAVGKSPIIITGRLKFYAPGEFTVPPVKISYTCQTCTKTASRSVKASTNSTNSTGSTGSGQSSAVPMPPPPLPDGIADTDSSAPPPDTSTPPDTLPAGSPVSSTNAVTGSAADSNVRFVQTQPVLFKVSSIIPAEKSENRLIVPTAPVSVDFRLPALHQRSLRYLWLGIFSLAGLFLCVGWFIYMRYRLILERDRTREGKRDGILVEQLRTLLQEPPSAPHWAYLGRVGLLLREYLVALCGGDARFRGGSGRHFMERMGSRLPHESVAPLTTILAAIDNSVAMETEHHQDMEALQREILEVVEATAQRSAAQG